MLTKLCVLSLALLAGASAQTLPLATAGLPLATGAYPYSAYPTAAYGAAYPTTAYPAGYGAYPAAYPGYGAYPYLPYPTAPQTPAVPQYQQPTPQKLTGPCQLFDTAVGKANNAPVSGVIQYIRQQPYCDTFSADAVSCRVQRSTLTAYAQAQCAAKSFAFA